MHDHLVKLGTSFIVGTAATAGLVRLVQWMPIPAYMKIVLAIVVPVPSIAIALVLLYYGNASQSGAEGLNGIGSPGELLKMFFFGCLATFGYAGISALVRIFLTPAEHDDTAEDDNA